MDTIYLIASLACLFAGPVLWSVLAALPTGSTRRRVTFSIDVLVMVSVTWLIVMEVLPEALHEIGYWVLPFFSAGLLLPLLLERVFRSLARQMHLFALLVAIGGILIHALMDGALLNHSAEAGHGHAQHGWEGLCAAIVVHRLPVALALWWLLYPSLGLRWAAPVLALMGVATLAGFGMRSTLSEVNMLSGMAEIHALVAGMILHAVFNRPHLDHDHSHAHHHPKPAAIDKPALAED